MQDKPIQGWLRTTAILAALAVPIAALAQQQAFTSDAVNLRAGPGTDYPVVAVLGQGQSLDVMGCTDGYSWCDVALPDGMRGWVSAEWLNYPYQGSPVPLVTYGAVIGVPLVSFAIGSYWGSYYRDRPWYGEPRWWHGRPPPPPMPGWRPPPPPRPNWSPRPPPPGWNGRPDFGRPGHVDRPGRPDYGRPDRPDRPGRPDDGRPGRPDYGRPDQGRPPPFFGGGRPDRGPDGRPPGGRHDGAGRPDGRPPGGGFGGGGRPDAGRPPPQMRPPEQARPPQMVRPPQQARPFEPGRAQQPGRPAGPPPQRAGDFRGGMGGGGRQAPNNP